MFWWYLFWCYSFWCLQQTEFITIPHSNTKCNCTVARIHRNLLPCVILSRSDGSDGSGGTANNLYWCSIYANNLRVCTIYISLSVIVMCCRFVRTREQSMVRWGGGGEGLGVLLQVIGYSNCSRVLILNIWKVCWLSNGHLE